MKTAIIITAYFEDTPKKLHELYSYFRGGNFDEDIFSDQKSSFFTLAADAGCKKASEAEIQVDLIAGDFDSLNAGGDTVPSGIDTVRLPVKKDDTDTGWCIKHALSRGAERIIVLGGLGGRADHTLGNLQLAAYAKEHGASLWIADSFNILTVIENETLELKKKEGFKLSLLSFSDKCENLSVSGVLYPLSGATFDKCDIPLGVSNEFVDASAKITVGNGKLIVAVSADPQSVF
ncbi:MAG: thiamine diphosphokinase [Clostridia bacterium]|nr:thiamine diphosphokinase [Clostridia bacterium]